MPHIPVPWLAAAAWLLPANLTAFILFGVDKRRAKRGMWRISEAALMTVSALGGAVGALLGMRVFHHKTRHRKFTLGIPAILLLELAAAVYIAVKVL